jgi:predicted ATPase
MKVEFSSPYKSVKKDIYKLVDFTVLTGENGSGKSNFLDGIRLAQDVKIDGNHSSEFSIKYYDYNSFPSSSMKDGYSVSPHISSNHNIQWNKYRLHKSGEYRLQPPEIRFCEWIAGFVAKDIDDLLKEDFASVPFRWTEDRLKFFEFHFFKNSATYISFFHDNRLNSCLNQLYAEDNIAYSDEQFRKIFGVPPWEIINNLFEEAGLEYELVVPPLKLRNQKIEAHIVDRVSNQEVAINDMSSGEKVILSVISFLYNLTIADKIPDVFLFDEVDALLHPFYSKKLVQIIKSTLVDKLKKKVIMTTHSPSTVAIVPEESLFLCQKQGFKIISITKDEALGRLTANINSLSVLHENRRQVFVEDHDDVVIYEKIRNYLATELIPDISLNFIPVSLSKTGGCDAVKDIVKSLNRHGNKQVFGIIDWDLKNNPSDDNHILVMGHNVRYSIENYLLDPLLLAAYLLREKIDCGLEKEYTYMQFSDYSNAQLQKIVDHIISFVPDELRGSNGNQTIAVEYMNGKVVSVPVWFFNIQGHQLEDFFSKKFKKLQAPKIYNGEKVKKLMFKILYYAMDDFRGYIPKDFLNIYLSIQEND